MSINVKFGIAANGHDNGQVQFRYHPEWHRDGNGARSYGCTVQADQLLVGAVA